VMLAISQLLH